MNLDNWVSQEFENLAQVINDYDYNLYLEMVPVAEQAGLIDKSKVFRIIDDKTKRIVMYADSLSNPVAILEKLMLIDMKHGSVIDRLDAHNMAQQMLKNERELQEREALRDFTLFVGKNTKSRWVHNDRVRDEHFNDKGPVRTHIT